MLAWLILSVAPSFAEEGMWLPEQVPDLAAAWAEQGLQLAPEALADPLGEPLGAIVSFGFCSGSFVSPTGLVATNHHCVESFLQYLSSAEANRHRDGYAASSPAEELAVGPTGRLWVLESIRDVTDEVVGGLRRRTTDAQRHDLIEAATKKLIATCEAQPHRRCRVASHYGGSEYRLLTSLEILDLRMVYAPSMGLGQFGGDIDNWMWPRHGADFSFLRAYVGPDGQPAPYSESNVPYQPRHHLTVSTEGVDPGGLVMVAGYPGSTDRHRLAEELEHHAGWYLPRSRALQQEVWDLLMAESARSAEAEARLGAPISRMANGMKNTDGLLAAFARRDLVGDKRVEEEAMLAWIRQDPKRRKLLEPVHAELLAALEEEATRERRELILGRVYGAADLLPIAHAALRWATEAKKPDASRDSGYQDRDRDRFRARLERLDRSLWLPADRAVLAAMLVHYQALPAEERAPSLDAWLKAQGGPEAALNRLFEAPRLASTEARLALIDQDLATLQASDDPWMQLAVAMEAHFEPEREAEEARWGRMHRLRSQWMAAKAEWYAQTGRPMYDDANSTLRLTVGTIKGYSPQDGLVALPQTTLAGLVAKVGEPPFDVPAWVVEKGPEGPQSRWTSSALGDVPVNHLSTLDITGGNSGSAVLDGKGRFVGLAFDGNWESIASDWVWLDGVTRCISMDVRFLLWVLESDPAGGRVLDELTR
jgi:hypothetical protein